MEYIERLIEILAIPPKFLFKIFAILLWLLVLCVHSLFFILSEIPIFVFQVLEWIFVYPIYYIVTGKKYYEKYNSISNMATDLLSLDRPYYIKSKEPKGGKRLFNLNYNNDEGQDLYSCFLKKIMEIDLKLNFN